MKFQPHEFQQATIDWVKEQIFETKNRPAYRFLIADEVGLGKTIITASLVDEIRRKTRTKAKIVYLTSSLDIARQNCTKLAAEHEIIEADRIISAFEQSVLDVPRRVARGERITRTEREKSIELYAFTPGTSIFIKKMTGTVGERRFLALLCMKFFGLSLRRAVRIFCHIKDEEGFKRDLGTDYRLKFGIDQDMKKSILGSWRLLKFKIDEKEVLFSDVLQMHLEPKQWREVVKELRSSLAKVLLAELNPKLIIIDEFQRCHGLVDWPVRTECKAFFKPGTPTLLLSATPYALAPSLSRNVGTHSGSEHYKDFERVLRFLFNEEKSPAKVIDSLGKYGQAILKVNGRTFEDLLQQKATVEGLLKKVMTRTERALFETGESRAEEKFLSSWISESNERTYSVNSIMEFLALREGVPHPTIMLNYWKSGGFSRTYMHDYEELKKAKWAKIKAKPQMLTDVAGQAGVENMKLNYLASNCLKDGENFKYLWVPPSRPYYAGKGIFEPSRLREANVKKALVFSVWSFVPRFIASELSMMKTKRLTGKNVLDLQSVVHTQVKPSTVNWLRFYYPSRLLADCLQHQDFVEAENLNSLLKLAKSRIRKAIEDRLGPEAFHGKGVGSRAWQVVKVIEFQDDGLDQLARSLYRPNGRDQEQLFGTKEYESLMKDIDKVYVSRRTLDELAMIAVASPSVCLLRTLNTLLGRPGNSDDAWSDAEFKSVMSLCIHEVRTFINRRGTFDAINSAYKGEGSPADRAEKYFVQGNIQAVLDEYLYLLQPKSEGRSLEAYLSAMKLVWGAVRNKTQVQVRGKEKKVSVTTDVAVGFSGDHLESDSRDNIRTSFNSPFWPFVLGTTSIGQEGLDFHLYCRDIYHWDLPSNPVAFEQREGRINRYNNLSVRQSITANVELKKVGEKEFVWDRLFEEAQTQCSPGDRYNFGLSPHWLYTPTKSDNTAKIQRHILDLPLSRDRRRYEKLMTDVIHYRLALGQPNQRHFLEALKSQKHFSDDEIRGLTLQLFPRHKRKRTENIQQLIASEPRSSVLVSDAMKYLDMLKGHRDHAKLVAAVRPIVDVIQEVLSGKRKRTRQYETAIKKLYYFIDPHDATPDFIPELGFIDDLKELKRAG